MIRLENIRLDGLVNYKKMFVKSRGDTETFIKHIKLIEI